MSFQEHNWDLKWLTKQIMMSARVPAKFCRSSGVRGGGSIRQAALAQGPDASRGRNHPRFHAEGQRADERKDVRPAGCRSSAVPMASGSKMTRRASTAQNRRSLYLAQTRTRWVSFLHVFDCPDMTSDNQPERFRSALADPVAGA